MQKRVKITYLNLRTIGKTNKLFGIENRERSATQKIHSHAGFSIGG